MQQIVAHPPTRYQMRSSRASSLTKHLKFLVPSCAFMLVCGVVWADPIPWEAAKYVTPPSFVPFILFADYVVDLFFILLTLAAFHKVASLPTRTLLAVGGIAAAGGLVADGIAGAIVDRLMHIATIEGNLSLAYSFLGRVLLPIPLILAVNLFLGRRYLALSWREAGVLGMVVGVFTTPIIYTAMVQFRAHWLGYSLHLYAPNDWFPLYEQLSSLACVWGLIVFGLLDIATIYLAHGRAAPRSSLISMLTAGIVLALSLLYLIPLNRERRLVMCQTNLKRIGVAIWMFEQNSHTYPYALESLVPRYLPVRGSLHCPEDSRNRQLVSYTYRKPGRAASEVRRPSETWMVKCSYHHSDTGPCTFVDGSVRWGAKNTPGSGSLGLRGGSGITH